MMPVDVPFCPPGKFDIGGKLRLNISQVEIALAEANVSFSCFEIEDLRNKPQWYIEKVTRPARCALMLLLDPNSKNVPNRSPL
jgi:hypothetical protein